MRRQAFFLRYLENKLFVKDAVVHARIKCVTDRQHKLRQAKSIMVLQ